MSCLVNSKTAGLKTKHTLYACAESRHFAYTCIFGYADNAAVVITTVKANSCLDSLTLPQKVLKTTIISIFIYYIISIVYINIYRPIF